MQGHNITAEIPMQARISRDKLSSSFTAPVRVCPEIVPDLWIDAEKYERYRLVLGMEVKRD